MRTEGKDTNEIRQRFLRSNSLHYRWTDRILFNASILSIQCTTVLEQASAALFPEKSMFNDGLGYLQN